MISIKGLQKYFNKNRQNEIHVIDDVTLDLPERGMVAVFGQSGCGKTTLLNVIGGLDGFDAGTLTVNGQDIRRDTDRIRNFGVGYIFQNYNLNREKTCEENVADALHLCGITDSGEIERRVRLVLTSVGMEKFRRRTPDTLSGGQQQRIAIARALVKNPPIILADEPTGNLDEANTILVMNLLKRISRDRLVLLVTHEAHLVDHYCDTVIELSDGRIKNIRHNRETNGYAARDKNDIYLGEYQKTELTGDAAVVEYYGDMPATPLRLRLINREGKMYLQLSDPTVKVLDEGSEMRVREGVYQQEAPQEEDSREMQEIAELPPPVDGEHYGKLYTFKSAVKSGYRANFHNGRRKGALRACMALFAIVLVCGTAFSGIGIGRLAEARTSYNHNVSYVYSRDPAVVEKLTSAVGAADTSIDAAHLTTYYPDGDQTVYFGVANFESFNTAGAGLDTNLTTRAVPLPMRLSEGQTIVAGRTVTARNEVLITTAVADRILKKTPLKYIDEYRDFVQMSVSTKTNGGVSYKIVGVVKSSESAIYLSPLALAQYAIGDCLRVTAASFTDIDVQPGTVVLNKVFVDNYGAPSAGDTITLRGQNFTVAEVITPPDPEDWDAVYETQSDANSDIAGVASAQKTVFVMNDDDYMALIQRYGKTSPFAMEYKEENGEESGYLYTTVHSSDIAKTTAYLEREFSDITVLDTEAWMEPMLVPSEVYRELIRDSIADIISNLISMVIMLAVMSICVYFIMRSSLLARVKEIGILRAIGVTKKNITFRFFIEALVLLSLTTLPGFLLAAIPINHWSGGAIMSDIFYLPWWLAAALLVVLYGVGILFGVLPVRLLLRKTPSEILAKYDI